MNSRTRFMLGLAVLSLTGCAPPAIQHTAAAETGDGDGDDYPCNIPGTPLCPDVGDWDPAGDGDGDGDGDGEACLPPQLCCIESDCVWTCITFIDPCPPGHVVIGAAPP